LVTSLNGPIYEGIFTNIHQVPQILCSTVHSLVATATWPPEFVDFFIIDLKEHLDTIMSFNIHAVNEKGNCATT